jgi:DNA polymerase III delta prime subunit
MFDSDLLIEKYRPKTIDEYVFTDDTFKKTVNSWIDNSDSKTIPIPNMLLSGKPGSGKTSLAKLIVRLVNVEDYDVLFINASKENNVEMVREKISNFCSTMPLGNFKVIILDESDYITPTGQSILRGEIERVSNSVRFILTCNYRNKIIPALLSRLQVFNFSSLDMNTYVNRIVSILDSEKISYKEDDIINVINVSYPDLRKTINLIDQHVIDKKLNPLTDKEDVVDEKYASFVKMFKSGDLNKARKFLVESISNDEYVDVYRYFYENVEIFNDKEEIVMRNIVIIAKYLTNHSLVADPEINLSACIVELLK